MRFSINVGSELELKLYRAILLYRNDHGNRVLATVHGVVQKETDGAPLLGAGQLLTTPALGELTKQLGRVAQQNFCPKCRRANSRAERLWARPQYGPCSSAMGLSSPVFPASYFPHPALLFVVSNGVEALSVVRVRS